MAGYETFRYDDADGEREVPMSGFKRWESSGYGVGEFLFRTDWTKTDARNRFIEEVNRYKKNKFVYHHIGLLHDLNGCGLGNFWDSEGYARNIKLTAEEFKKLYYEYLIEENDLVILSSDHGVILDKDYKQDGIENGERHYEQSAKAFFALMGKDIAPQILTQPISALDIAPTLLHIALDMSMEGQGRDQFSYIKNGSYQKTVFYREKGSYNVPPELQNPLSSDVYYIRDDKWKYVFGERDTKCEWLIDLEKDRDYEINLKDKYPELVQKYRKMLKEKLEEGKHFQYKSFLGFDKSSVKKMFSLILQGDKIQRGTVESLLDLAGPYYEIVLYDLKEELEFDKNCYKIRLSKERERSQVEKECDGEWLVVIRGTGEWSEHFLSDLYRYIQCHRNKNVIITGRDYIAFRKEDRNRCDHIELFEKDEVRTVIPSYKKDSKRKYIIFGSGNLGKEALSYLGEENVYCFVDNKETLIGKKLYGKEIISFAELQKVFHNYTIVVATKPLFAFEIKRQLDSNGIYKYQFFEIMKKDVPNHEIK